MKKANLNDMIKGWFVGDFEPSVLRSKDVEVAIKHYRAGEVEELHVHKIAHEITAVVSGRCILAGQELEAGDILTLEPGEPACFEVLEDTITVVVKMPSVMGDKYILND